LNKETTLRVVYSKYLVYNDKQKSLQLQFTIVILKMFTFVKLKKAAMDFEKFYQENNVQSLYGRYITLEDIEPILKKWNTNNQLNTVGYSVEKRPIYSYQIGTGRTKIFLWSQMHGNESTTTKALFDFLNLLQKDSEISRQLVESFTFYCLPMVNPDGAFYYTRENANKIDLNRDSLKI
jgi:murein tripeptide amidase MpaA